MRSLPVAERALLLGLLLLFVLTGLLYDLTVPIYEKPDESHHFAFAVRLARGDGLPVQGEEARSMPWRQEGSQPPLYYLLASIPLRFLQPDKLELELQPNPHTSMGVPTVIGNKNVYLHPPGEALDTPTARAVHVARWISLLLGLITVVAVFQFARELVPDRPLVAWIVTVFVAFTPQFLFISTSASNDTAVTAATSIALWLLVRAVKRGLTVAEGLALGVASGAAALAKLNGLLFLPLAVGTLVLVAWRDRKRARAPHTVSPLLLAGGLVAMVALIAGWWYWRNWVLYHDPTGLRAMLAIVGVRDDPLTFRRLRWEFDGLRISYWALFGWFNILADAWVYPLLDGLLLVAGLGCVIGLLRWFRGRDERPWAWLPWLPVVVWPLVVLVGLLRWTAATLGSQGRLLFPAIGAIAILIVVGLLTLVPRKVRAPVFALAGVLWVFWALSIPPRFLVPAYSPPPHGFEIALPSDATPLNWRYGPVELLGYRLRPSKVDRSEPFYLTLYWRASEPLHRNYSVGVKLFGRNKQLLARSDSYPGHGSYQTTEWKVGETVVDEHVLWVSGEADTPVLGDIWVDFYTLEDFAAFPVVTSRGEQLGVPSIARLKVAPSVQAQVAPVQIRFADGIAAGTSRVGPTEVEAGHPVTATLVWQPYATPAADYTVFLHVVHAGAEGPPVAQVDRAPRDGSYPTTVWAAGESVTDTYSLTLPASVPPGDYDLIGGLYRADTFERLSVVNPESLWRLARIEFDGRRWRVHPTPLASAGQ